jgi:hypothetical protein
MSQRAEQRGFPVPIDHLADIVQALQGLKEHRSLEEIAGRLGLDERSLCRRLNEAATAGRRQPLYKGKPADITEAGEWFLQEALPVVEAYRGRLFPHSAVPFAVVVACYPSLTLRFLPRVFRRLGLTDGPEATRPAPPERFDGALQVLSGERQTFFRGLAAGTVHLVIATAGVPAKLRGVIEETPLFDAAPLGLIYHKDNPKHGAWRKGGFALEHLATERFFWLGPERRHGIEGPLARVLPGPTLSKEKGAGARRGARIEMPAYQAVLEMVRHGAGVGIGHEPVEAQDRDRLGFIDLRRLALPREADASALRGAITSRFSLFTRRQEAGPDVTAGCPEAVWAVSEAIVEGAKGPPPYLHRFT